MKEKTQLNSLINDIGVYTKSLYYTSKVLSEICDFTDNYRVNLLIYLEKYPNTNLVLENYLKDIIEFLKYINKNLLIKDEETFKRILINLELSKLSLEDRVEFEDLDNILNSFFRLEPSLKTYGII